MAISEIIVGPKELETSDTLQLTLTKDYNITGIYISNRTAGTLTADVRLVPPSGSSINAFRFVPSASIFANDLRPIFPIEIPLKLGSKIYASAGGAGINIWIVATDPRP